MAWEFRIALSRPGWQRKGFLFYMIFNQYCPGKTRSTDSKLLKLLTKVTVVRFFDFNSKSQFCHHVASFQFLSEAAHEYVFSENAVNTQRMSGALALTAGCHRLDLDLSLHQILQILSTSLFEKTPILQGFLEYDR